MKARLGVPVSSAPCLSPLEVARVCSLPFSAGFSIGLLGTGSGVGRLAAPAFSAASLGPSLSATSYDRSEPLGARGGSRVHLSGSRRQLRRRLEVVVPQGLAVRAAAARETGFVFAEGVLSRA